MLLQVKLHYGKCLDIHCEYLDSLQCDQTGRVAWMLQCGLVVLPGCCNVDWLCCLDVAIWTGRVAWMLQCGLVVLPGCCNVDWSCCLDVAMWTGRVARMLQCGLFVLPGCCNVDWSYCLDVAIWTGRVAGMLQCAWTNHRHWASNIHSESIYYLLD